MSAQDCLISSLQMSLTLLIDDSILLLWVLGRVGLMRGAWDNGLFGQVYDGFGSFFGDGFDTDLLFVFSVFLTFSRTPFPCVLRLYYPELPYFALWSPHTPYFPIMSKPFLSSFFWSPTHLLILFLEFFGDEGLYS